jgi:16S rRNA (guanine527-N7)-methyltransferase
MIESEALQTRQACGRKGQTSMPQHRARAEASPDLSADRRRALALNPVSRETARRIDRFVELLLKWQRVTNLIAPSSIPGLWTRHVADSLQLLPLAPDAHIWIDLGTGGGFPGLVLGCALADMQGASVHLVESNGKKAAFLREAVRITGAAANVHHARAEVFVETWEGPVDVVTARALAPLPALLDLADPLIKRGAKALLLKGQHVEAELTEAAKCWNIETEVLSSRTDPKGRIVLIRKLKPLDLQPKSPP